MEALQWAQKWEEYSSLHYGYEDLYFSSGYSS